MVIRNLSNHPDAKESRNRLALAQAQKDVNNNFTKLEVLQPRINKRYERYEQLLRDRDARRAAVATISQNPENTESAQSTHEHFLSNPAITRDSETVAAGDNRDLAVQMAHKEIKRRATARKATRQAGISEEVEHERRTAGVWGNWEDALTKDDEELDHETLSMQIQSVRSQVDGSTSGGPRNSNLRPSFASQRSNFHYPTVPEHGSSKSWIDPSLAPDSLAHRTMKGAPGDHRAPELPAKGNDYGAFESTLPPRPSKEIIQSHDRLLAPAINPASQHDVRPAAFSFEPSAYLENGTPLRTIFLPPDLRQRFLSIAMPNTRANLETCGILCGTLISNALFISKLVIPDQQGTSDTCETINESELFDYVDGEDLMVLGWIHTHPTQTCFMSSRDLHTHGGYQVMMAESIAIVCAPSKGDWGAFRLTDPPGMKNVLNCTQTGLFHPHDQSNIYTDALRPGHVCEAKGLEFDVVDLRPIQQI